MPQEAPAKPDPNPDPNAKVGPDGKPLKPEPKVEGPPDEDFWEKYNHRLEFPISTVGAVLIHVLVAAVLVFAFSFLMSGDDRAAVPIKLVEGGFDDEGEGSMGSGGQDEPLLQPDKDDPLVPPDMTPVVPEIPPPTTNPSDLTDPITQPKAPAKANRGQGNEKGRGYDGTAGTGPGGTGNDSTRARSQRWVLRFKTTGTRDYVDQIATIGAIILIPRKDDPKKYLIVKDPRNPRPEPLSDAEMAKLSNEQVHFSDNRKETLQDLARILQLEYVPPRFWVVFNKGLEEDLARKETGYRGRKADSIEETIFKVTVKGGSYTIEVEDQKVRR